MTSVCVCVHFLLGLLLVYIWYNIICSTLQHPQMIKDVSVSTVSVIMITILNTL